MSGAADRPEDRTASGNGDRNASADGNGGAGEGWLQLALTAILALAAVGTAWAGFQSAKWGGVQANSYAQASAARTESTRSSTEAGQFLTIDVITFTQWLAALNEEITADPSAEPEVPYQPDPDRLSGFLFSRFRSEFKPAVAAWLETRPLANPDAPPTPFAMPEYQLAAQTEALEQFDRAEHLSATARQANQRSDNYVLTAVLFALVLFFAALTGRARGPSQWVLFGLAVFALLGALALLATYPIEV